MPAPITIYERILDAAERRIRGAGYNAVSFRDIAGDVGVKSASVHYHFAQKQDLGAALVRRYKERFVTALESISTGRDRPDSSGSPDGRPAMFRAYLELYRDALIIDQSVCLCAILGAEAIGLPELIRAEIRLFFQANIDWLGKTFAPWPVRTGAMSPLDIVAGLEGAMIIAAVMADDAVLARTISHMQAVFEQQVSGKLATGPE
jgi:TetR/AcrR family transcriptional repressor of nem operon